MSDTTTETTPMTIGERIRQFRYEQALTQEDLAAKAGLSVATIQRLEAGEPPSVKTIASIAAAFNLSPTALTSASAPPVIESVVGSYLPLTVIKSGKRLVDLMASASVIDFDYMDIDDETVAGLLGCLYKFCLPHQDSIIPDNPADRIRLDMEASKLLKELDAKGLTVASETYDRTCYDVYDDGDGMPVCFGTWEETCLVLRVGTDGVIVDRADVDARMGKWTSTNDPRIIRPHSPKDDKLEQELEGLFTEDTAGKNQSRTR